MPPRSDGTAATSRDMHDPIGRRQHVGRRARQSEGCCQGSREGSCSRATPLTGGSSGSLVVLTITLVVSVAAVGRTNSFQEVVPFTISDGLARLAWATATAPVVLQFTNDVPRDLEIMRLARSGQDRNWRLADTMHVVPAGDRVVVEGPIGIETLMLVRARDRPGYLLDGPFRWPSRPSTYIVLTKWRKTIRGTFSDPHATLQWLSADDEGDRGAGCEWRDRTEWECVGIPLHAHGVVVMITNGQVTCGIPSAVVSPAGVDVASTRTSAWGRLVVVERPKSDVTRPLHITAVRPAASGELPLAPRSARTERAIDTRVHVDLIADGVAWIAGAEVPEDGWLEIEAADGATERVELRELARGLANTPLRVQVVRPSP
jgi:hypothetical protein